MYAGYLERASPSPFSRQLFVAAAIVQSSATFGWDVVMDWGLPAKRAGGELFGTWTLSAMREPRSHVVGAGAAYAAYGALVAFNLVLRYIWAVAVFGGASTRGTAPAGAALEHAIRCGGGARRRQSRTNCAPRSASTPSQSAPASGTRSSMYASSAAKMSHARYA